MYRLYYYEYYEDIKKEQFLQKEEYETLESAYGRLSDLYDNGEIPRTCYESAYIVSDDRRKYYVIDISDEELD